MNQQKVTPVLSSSKGQHPSIGKDLCNIQYCDELSAQLKEKTYVGHATTHDGQNRPQYAKIYAFPKPNYDSAGQHIDQIKTIVLHNNKEINANIHMNSSRNPTENDNTST